MKIVNKEVLKDAANRLLFEMSDEQYATLLEEFDTIRAQFNLIGQIDGVDEASPMVFPFDVTIDVLRDDEVENVLTKEEVLMNAHSTQDGQIKLPKVI